MKITKLDITQFRGLSNVLIDEFGKVNVFSGKNGIGKTTLIDCIMWMLSDETFTYGVQNEDNKNKHNTKDVIEVEMTINDNSNQEYVLKRTYFEKWKADVFQKIENKFEINGAKYTSTEYFAKIREIVGIREIKTKKINPLRLMMDTSYIDNIDYKIAREFIEELLGVVSDIELAKEPEYEIIKATLDSQQTKEGKYDIAKTKSAFKNVYDTASKRIEELKLKIKSDEQTLKNFPIDDFKNIDEEKNEVLNSVVENDPRYIECKKSIDDVMNSIDNLVKDQQDEKRKLEEAINNNLVEGNKCKNEIASLNNTLKLNNTQLKDAQSMIEGLKTEIKAIEEKQFVEVRCPNCNELINVDEQKNFENDKKNAIAKINSDISKYENTIKTLNKSVTDTEDKIAQLQNSFNKAGKEYVANTNALQTLNKQLEDNTELASLNTKLEELNTNIANIKVIFNNEKNDKIKDLMDKSSQLGGYNQLTQLIANNKNEISSLNEKKALAELQMQVLEQFKQRKLALVRENTNKVFPNIEFEMLYESPTTGVLTECCYAKYKDVEFNGVNNGNRYPLGIEVIENIKSAMGIVEDLPILIDRYADLDKDNLKRAISLTNAQIFTTVVSESSEIKVIINN